MLPSLGVNFNKLCYLIVRQSFEMQKWFNILYKKMAWQGQNCHNKGKEIHTNWSDCLYPSGVSCHMMTTFLGRVPCQPELKPGTQNLNMSLWGNKEGLTCWPYWAWSHMWDRALHVCIVQTGQIFLDWNNEKLCCNMQFKSVINSLAPGRFQFIFR